MFPRKQTTDPKLMILVSFFSGEVTSYTDTNYCIPIMLEVCRSVFMGHPVYACNQLSKLQTWLHINISHLKIIKKDNVMNGTSALDLICVMNHLMVACIVANLFNVNMVMLSIILTETLTVNPNSLVNLTLSDILYRPHTFTADSVFVH